MHLSDLSRTYGGLTELGGRHKVVCWSDWLDGRTSLSLSLSSPKSNILVHAYRDRHLGQ